MPWWRAKSQRDHILQETPPTSSGNTCSLTYEWSATILGYHYREGCFCTYQKPHRFPLSQKSPHQQSKKSSHQQSKGRNEREEVRVCVTTEIRIKRLRFEHSGTHYIFKYLEYTLSILKESPAPNILEGFWYLLISFGVYTINQQQLS